MSFTYDGPGDTLECSYDDCGTAGVGGNAFPVGYAGYVAWAESLTAPDRTAVGSATGSYDDVPNTYDRLLIYRVRQLCMLLVAFPMLELKLLGCYALLDTISRLRLVERLLLCLNRVSSRGLLRAVTELLNCLTFWARAFSTREMGLVVVLALIDSTLVLDTRVYLDVVFVEGRCTCSRS